MTKQLAKTIGITVVFFAFRKNWENVYFYGCFSKELDQAVSEISILGDERLGFESVILARLSRDLAKKS